MYYRTAVTLFELALHSTSNNVVSTLYKEAKLQEKWQQYLPLNMCKDCSSTCWEQNTSYPSFTAFRTFLTSSPSFCWCAFTLLQYSVVLWTQFCPVAYCKIILWESFLDFYWKVFFFFFLAALAIVLTHLCWGLCTDCSNSFLDGWEPASHFTGLTEKTSREHSTFHLSTIYSSEFRTHLWNQNLVLWLYVITLYYIIACYIYIFNCLFSPPVSCPKKALVHSTQSSIEDTVDT